MPTPEGKIKAKVNKVLKALGADCHRFMPVQTGFGSPGLDYHLCVRGLAVFIETKKPGGKLTPLQETTRTNMLNAGAVVLVVTNDDDIEMMTGILNGIGSDYRLLDARAHSLYAEHLRAYAADRGASCSATSKTQRNRKAA